MEMNYYIHVPFCASKCGYCVFYSESAPGNDIQERYLNKLFSDLERSEFRTSTIYIGGGTPTLFNAEQLERFLETVCSRLEPDDQTEISIEANPETLTPEKVAVL
jgi:oxygen-independent coproporphyrinogen-3 oxidase